VRAELAGAKAAAQTAKDHAAQRLADQHTHYAEPINALRAQLPHPRTSHADAAGRQEQAHEFWRHADHLTRAWEADVKQINAPADDLTPASEARKTAPRPRGARASAQPS
jgi:hypothetical protein